MSDSNNTAYYAVCNANGPISVELDGNTVEEALEAFAALDGRAAIDDASTDLEDALDICGEGMSEGDFERAAEAAGATFVRSLGDTVRTQAGVAAVAGGWSLWCVGGADEDGDDAPAEWDYEG